MIRRPPRSTLSSSSAASDVYKRQAGHPAPLLRPVRPEPPDRILHPGRRGLEPLLRVGHAAPPRLISPPMSGAPNITWHEGDVSRGTRAGVTGGAGATLWFTGLSGSGKSTLAAAVERRLVAGGRAAYRLDGDNLRTGINADLGFSREERLENCRRVAEVARLFADASMVAVVAVISPYAESRAFARRIHAEASLPFVEVFMAT